MMRSARFLAAALVAALFAAGTGCSIHAKADKKSKQVMEEGFKGKDSLCARIADGKGTDAEFFQMVELTRQLALNRPPRGDLRSWVDKTDALYAAAVNLSGHKAGAVDEWKAAANCKACHSLHKPESKGGPAPAPKPDAKPDAKAK